VTDANEIRAMFPDLDKEGESFSMCCGLGYEGLVSKFCASIELNEPDDEYQGDSFLLLRDADGRLGYLKFGWGSCSGCDALQGCESFAELAELFDSLRDSVRWFESDDAAKAWFLAHDWKGDAGWGDGCRNFIGALNTRFNIEIAEPER